MFYSIEFEGQRENINPKEICKIRDFCRISILNSHGDGKRTLENLEGLFLNAFSYLFNLAGSLLIIYGGLRAIVEIVLCEVLKKPYSYQQMRKGLMDKIVFGLEFFIATDVLETTRHPTQEKLIILGTVVLIRTVLGYFLSKEVSEYQLD
jgi:uncharacterized membrane protein